MLNSGDLDTPVGVFYYDGNRIIEQYTHFDAPGGGGPPCPECPMKSRDEVIAKSDDGDADPVRWLLHPKVRPSASDNEEDGDLSKDQIPGDKKDAATTAELDAEKSGTPSPSEASAQPADNIYGQNKADVEDPKIGTSLTPIPEPQEYRTFRQFVHGLDYIDELVAVFYPESGGRHWPIRIERSIG